MARGVGLSSRPAAVVAPPARGSFIQRGWAKASLLLLSIALLTLSFAPFKQFYLAWVALVPWLVVVRGCRSARSAFGWSWLAGVGFFAANMWWLAWVTGPGMLALLLILGLYWGLAGMLIGGARLLDLQGRSGLAPAPLAATSSLFLIATIWVATEWLRGTWPFGGLAWQYLGYTQSPALHQCQIADITGAYGVSFWVALVNAWVALLVLNRRRLPGLVTAGVAVGIALMAVAAYGFYRFSQKTTRPGPMVMVVQPDYPQSNSGEKGADLSEILRFHLEHTKAALAREPKTDLVVWSETMMPPLNASAIERLHDPSGSTLPEVAQGRIDALAERSGAAFLVGGMYWDGWVDRGAAGWRQTQERNSAYFFVPGPSGATLRYDKVHLVPFGEYIPFQTTFPPLYHLLLTFSPYPKDYIWLTPGAPDALTVFSLRSGWRFVTPICFEDLDGPLLRRMFQPPPGQTRKRADFIVNITNDGWFRFSEMPQHLQAAIFRSIENRAPTARSVNTGISGFIDSVGRTYGLVPAGRGGVSIARVDPDERLTFYTRFGDVFAYICAALTALMAARAIGEWWKQRGQAKEAGA